MKRLTKLFKGGQKGFTLIELLIVIVILGVLAAAIIPNLSKFLGSGQLGAANAELASVRTAIAAYQADHNGVFPCTVQPIVGTNQPLVYADVVAYITGTSGIKGVYTINLYGQVVSATNGPAVANGPVWPITLTFDSATGTPPTLQWIKTP